MQDYRWLLFGAFPFGCLAAWALARPIPIRGLRWLATLSGCILVTAALIGINNLFPMSHRIATPTAAPSPSPVITSPSASVLPPTGTNAKIFKRPKSHQTELKTANYSNGLKLLAYAVGGSDYPEGTQIGGIKWDKAYTDIRIELINVLGVAVEKIDLFVAFDIHIKAAKQFGTTVPDVSIAPADSNITFIALGGTDTAGNPITTPIDPIGPMLTTVYHVICPRLSAGGHLGLIIATIALNPPTNGAPPKTMFANRRAPKVVKIRGTYETGVVDGAQRYSIDFTHEFK